MPSQLQTPGWHPVLLRETGFEVIAVGEVVKPITPHCWIRQRACANGAIYLEGCYAKATTLPSGRPLLTWRESRQWEKKGAAWVRKRLFFDDAIVVIRE
jgi:hypothetical protein